MSLVETPGKLLRRAELYNQLGSYISSGVTLRVALDSLSSKRSARRFQGAILKILNTIDAGGTFGEAINKVPESIPEFDRALLESGESSGRLDVCFKMLGEYYADTASLVGKTIWAMVYPFFIVHLAIIIFPVTSLVEAVQGDLTGFLIKKGLTLGAVYGLIIFLMYCMSNQRSSTWRAVMEKMMGFIPLLGAARKNLALARLSASLGGLLSAGVGTVEAWALAGRSCGSETLKRVTQKMGKRINEGETPGALISRNSAFPDLFVSAYEAGEMSGKLDDSLERIYRNYKEEASSKLQQFSTWLPILFFLVVGISVGYQIITFYMERMNDAMNAF